ncbi:hypothetical protein COCSADRAFT_95594 [Bipolaris sorokiniana ND90Pr]|uniref:CSI2 protein n=1 Tax=Cochliobolus sativus (strain ND90Pr / ATCC 201652) TaxID=665912 RepID=M2SYZ8_COCSN|nr:uncharacterized protein COCSADRAFT_95594 [Bipolaris sorokiniana ND90Pr]EMD62012.1 hypothetical protein COCSADRAFT_95594 [Bipolaris sorokiniana ND90Pr]
MRPSAGIIGLLLIAVPTVLAQGNNAPNAPNAPDGTTTTQPTNDQTTQTTANTQTSQTATSATTEAASTTQTQTGSRSVFNLAGAPTLAGVGIPVPKIPDTSGAAFMQKSSLPDGTVFICVGAILAFFGAALMAWRGLVAWSLHRSVKRAALSQNMTDVKSMTAMPPNKRGMYNVVGANSTMSLDRLNAAPIGKSSRPFTGAPTSSSQRPVSSLFFSPTAGGATGIRDSVVNRSSAYLPAGYYASGTSAPASGSPQMNVGGQNFNNLSALSLSTPGNRFSARSGTSPPESPSLPPSRGGYSRAPPSREGLSVYKRSSVATLTTPGNTRSGVFGQDNNPSQLSLNVPGGTNVPGGRTPSGYLEDLFEHHGTNGNNGTERF